MACSSNNLPLVLNFPPCIHYNAFLTEWLAIKCSNPISHGCNNTEIPVELRSSVRQGIFCDLYMVEEIIQPLRSWGAQLTVPMVQREIRRHQFVQFLPVSAIDGIRPLVRQGDEFGS
jgi:hypothetical protein